MSVYAFDSPVGYAKNPLAYRQQPHRHRGDAAATPVPATSQTIDRLPLEIRATIANELSQFDCYSLMQTNSAMYEACTPRLYQNIVVDQEFTPFNKECEFHQHQYVSRQQVRLSCSYIKSAYSFKRFLHTYRGHKAIKRFQCLSLPDSINMFDYDVSESMNRFFSTVFGLVELVWLNDNFRLEFLDKLQHKSNVKTLILNIKFNNYLFINDEEVFRKFANLENFQIKPFQNANKLNKLLCPTISKLRILKLSRNDKDLTVLTPDCKKLVTTNLVTIQDYDLNSVDHIFKYKLENLVKLSLNNILISSDHYQKIIDSVDLHKLEKLELKNISEYQEISSLDELKPSVLVRIGPHLTSLKELCIDYRESYKDSVPEFLENIPSRHITAIDLVIRLNETKMVDSMFYIRYSNSLLAHNRKSTLRKLSIEIKHENKFCDLNVPINFKYFEIHKLQQLQSLRFNSQNELITVDLIKQLPNLQYLTLFGVKAGGSPNLGLGMIHPNVYDEWLKVQHVALIYLKYNFNLRYIKINEQIFECDGTNVTPRDGIDRWYNERVRVDNDVDLY